MGETLRREYRGFKMRALRNALSQRSPSIVCTDQVIRSWLAGYEKVSVRKRPASAQLAVSVKKRPAMAVESAVAEPERRECINAEDIEGHIGLDLREQYLMKGRGHG